MGFSSKYFTAIAFCLASTIVPSFEELIMLRHPPTNDGSMRNLTCVSDDDDAALIWNFNSSPDMPNDFTDFQPKKRTSQNVSECAIWNSPKCLAEWESINEWGVVNSSMKPMGPALDFRWEEFREFVFDKSVKEQDYQYVGKVKESSGSAVFSIRGLPDVHIYLCENRDPTKGLCFWINFRNFNGLQSSISTCPAGAPKFDESKPEKYCKELNISQHKTENIVKAYEWRTFTLNWNEYNRTIQVFKDRENKPFLQARSEEWGDVSHISIRSAIATRFRFHFYEYFLTEKKNSLLRTKVFNQYNEDFCVELIVGLCPECGLKLNLVNTQGQSLMMKNIPKSEKSTYNELLKWKAANLKTNDGIKGRAMRLEIETILNSNDGKGQWAIGNLRTCQPVGGFRESTMTFHRNISVENPVWLPVTCQKLSDTYDTVVNSGSARKINQISSQLKHLFRKYYNSCAPSCANSGNVTSVCTSDGCVCDQGFKGNDCNEQCTAGYHGYNCIEKCGSCDDGACNAETGYCRANCKGEKFLPPFCKKELAAPTIKDVTETTAKAFQSVELPADIETRIVLVIEGRLPLEISPSRLEGPTIYEVNIADLSPNTTYNAHTSIIVRIKKKDMQIDSPITYFTTKAVEKPRPVLKLDIQGLEVSGTTDTGVTLRWTPLSENEGNVMCDVTIEMVKLLGCEDIRKPTPPHKEIRRTGNNREVSVDSLHPYANYTATVRARTRTAAKLGTVKFLTNATDIPMSKVSNLRLGNKNLSLEWERPTDCTTITGPVKGTRLFLKGVSDSVRGWEVTEQTSYLYLNLTGKKIHLLPYTWYKVRAHVIRGFNLPENPNIYQELTWRTPATAPTAVKNLEIYGPDLKTKTISVRWLPPNPANGEIEYYQVSIGQKKKSNHQTQTVGVSEAASNCDKQFGEKNYLCYKNLKLPTNFTDDDIEIEVRAKNKDVGILRAKKSVLFMLKSHFKEPSQPLNLTATSEAHGIVKLKWFHPSISDQKIVRFIIRVEVWETHLLENITAKFPITKNYPVLEAQKNYIEKLYLRTSTKYRISVKAVDEINLTSSQAQVNILVGGGVALASDEKLQKTRNGTLINLIIPKVVNATKETTVSVNIKGSITCAGDKSQESSSLSNPRNLTLTVREAKNKTVNLPIDTKKMRINASTHCSLDLGEAYEITVILEDQFSGKLVKLAVPERLLPDNKGQNLTWLIILPIIIIIVVCVFLFIRHRKREIVPTQDSYAEVVPLSKRKTVGKSSTEILPKTCERRSSTPPLPKTNKNRLSNHVYAVPYVSESNSVSMICFEDYAKEAAFSGLINSQYGMFPRGLTRPCDYGRLPQNMPKNRNKNVIAYDDTRVILDKIPGDPYSDYINANYIKGYGEESAYIATQGPKRNTVNDFWRMIWQKKVRVICMLTNVVENGQTMCEKYWPEVGCESTYGNITVLNRDHQVFADYTFRTLNISNEEESRKVMHLHYTGWPSHGVPMYSQSLVTYLKRLVEILDGHGPVVIHCSSGDGRTGTIILCDMCMRQGIVDKEIEVAAVTKRMYLSRANMLDNPQQYLLAHVIIAESITSITTQIACTDVLPSRIKTLREQLPFHVKRLNDTVWQERALHSSSVPQHSVSTILYDNKLPNLSQATVESDIYESTYASESNYIKSVSVDGVKIKNQYLASQLPSVSVLPDFWRFIAERNIELVIILQRPDPDDPTVCDVMPGESILVPVPYIQVETKSSYNETEPFTVDKLLLTDTSEETARTQYVTVLTCNEWECGDGVKPPAAKTLVSLWRASENIPRKGGLTLVLCQNGIRGCGLYLALSFLLERMAVERECDVISAVRAVRRFRPEFVQPLSEFDYLYDAAINYSECFQTYANFS